MPNKERMTVFQQVRQHIEKVLQNHATEPIVVYTGIGTAAGYLSANGTLEAANYHQYPPFLQELKQRHQNLRLYIILIDPRQEDPPYLTKMEPYRKLHNGTDTCWLTLDGFTRVYVWRTNVGTVVDLPLADEKEAANDNISFVDITTELVALNAFAVEHSICTFYHDFTGRRNHLLAEYFDKDPHVRGHLDYIIYGFSARQDHGCYFDLTNDACFYAYHFDKGLRFRHPLLRVFNYFHFINMGLSNQQMQTVIEQGNYNKAMLARITAQGAAIINGIKTKFRNQAFATLRLIYNMMTDDDDDDNNIQNLNFCQELAPEMRVIVRQRLIERQHAVLFEELMHYFGKLLDPLVFLAQIDVTGYEMLSLVVNGEADPYNWYDVMLTFLPPSP